MDREAEIKTLAIGYASAKLSSDFKKGKKFESDVKELDSYYAYFETAIKYFARFDTIPYDLFLD